MNHAAYGEETQGQPLLPTQGLLEKDLIDETSEEESDLHEHEVRGGIEVGETEEGEIVVETVESGGDQV